MNDVKPKRTYRSRRREEQAESTHNAVLDAAERLFRDNGWTATTIAAIAREADVSPETVYSRFGNKRTIVHQLLARAMRGADQKTPMMQQQQRADLLRMTDGRNILDAFCDDICDLLARAAPILAVVRSAAENDADMGELYAELHAGRRRNLGELITALERTDALRPGLDAEMATDTLWSIVSPELWSLRMDRLRTTPAANREWIRMTLSRLLLGQA